MQIATLAMLCGTLILALWGCPARGHVRVMLKMRGSCDGKCKEFKCGTPNPATRDGRVVGGKPTESHKYPWLVAFTYGAKLYCSGTLINDRWVLTAAHCIRNIKTHRVTLTLGSYNKTANNELSRQVRKIGTTWFHPSFHSRTFNHDIGLVKLNTPVVFTDQVRPICLPSNRNETYEGKMAIVAGWGRLSEFGNASNLVREVTVPIMTNEECKTKNYKPRDITNNMMCAGYDAGKIDACQGDSGGPLMYRRGSRVDIIGLVSWGEGCARPRYPGVYTRLSKYWDVIETKINEEPGCSCSAP